MTRKVFMIVPIILCVGRAACYSRGWFGMECVVQPCCPPPVARPRSHTPFRRFLVTCYAVEWDSFHVAINSGVLAVSLIAKLPEMHGVRIMQINAARVD